MKTLSIALTLTALLFCGTSTSQAQLIVSGPNGGLEINRQFGHQVVDRVLPGIHHPGHGHGDHHINPPSTIYPGVTPPSTIYPGVTPPNYIHPGYTPPSTIYPGVTPPHQIHPGYTPPYHNGPGFIGRPDVFPITPPVTTYPIHPPVWSLPQQPLIVTPNQFRRINPYTGGIDTTNQQVDNTYFDPTRNASQNNGTKRYVRRPIYDVNGRITGYSHGYVWNNTHTGVEHGELKNVTDNGMGGTNEQIQVKAVR